MIFDFLLPQKIEAVLWLAKWDKLADYNAEVSRGIMHTPEYVAKMEALKRQYNLEYYGTETPEPGAVYFKKSL